MKHILLLIISLSQGYLVCAVDAVVTSLSVINSNEAIDSTQAPLTVVGGAAIGKNLEVGGTINISGTGIYAQNGDFLVGQDTALNNVAVGMNALGNEVSEGIITGGMNTAIGILALTSLNQGFHNTALGYNAGAALDAGSSNTLIGSLAGSSLVSDLNSVFIGYKAGQNNSGASGNVFIGAQAGQSNVNGINNFFGGYQAGQMSINSNQGTFVGTRAGLNNNGPGNTFIGALVGQANTMGAQNTFIGNSAGSKNTIKNSSTLIGSFAGANNNAGSNTMLGASCGRNTTIGGFNTFIGQVSGFNNIEGTYNTCIGYGADFIGSDDTNAMALGANAKVFGSNRIRIGDPKIATIEAQVSMTVASDAHAKRNIKMCNLGLNFINALKPVSYCMCNDMRESYGLIAQDVEVVLEEFNCPNFGGLEKHMADGSYGLRYNDFIAILVKAVQELSARVKELEAKNTL